MWCLGNWSNTCSISLQRLSCELSFISWNGACTFRTSSHHQPLSTVCDILSLNDAFHCLFHVRRDCKWCTLWRSKQTLPRCSFTFRMFFFWQYTGKCNFSFTPIRQVQPSLHQFSQNWQMFNSNMCRSLIWSFRRQMWKVQVVHKFHICALKEYLNLGSRPTNACW